MHYVLWLIYVPNTTVTLIYHILIALLQLAKEGPNVKTDHSHGSQKSSNVDQGGLVILDFYLSGFSIICWSNLEKKIQLRFE